MTYLWHWFVAAPWNLFVRSVGWLVQYCVREANPRDALAIYLAFNAIVTVTMFFVTATWPDFFTIAGYWATITGLLVAFVELYRTRMVAVHIREAVIKENERQRGFHYRKDPRINKCRIY